MDIQPIHNKIHEVRNQKVMLDFDLAALYEVETRVLNQAVKRNADLFPADFMFRLSREEWEHMSSQIVMTYPLRRPKTAPPLAFTEHGVAMLSNVLKSRKARLTSVAIIRAFIALKQYSLNYEKLADKIKALEAKYNKQFSDAFEAIHFLIEQDKKDKDQKNRKPIGY